MSSDSRFTDRMKNGLAEVGARVRQLRKNRGFSQVHLAELVGIDRSYMGKIERGEVNFSILILSSVALALSVSPSVILEEPDEGD